MKKKLKIYIKAKVQAISLTADQAVLQVCRVGGAYFGWNAVYSSRCVAYGSTGVGAALVCGSC